MIKNLGNILCNSPWGTGNGGNKDHSPWGNGGNRPSSDDNDLDALLKKSQEKLRRAMGGGGGGSTPSSSNNPKHTALMVGLFAFALIAMQSLSQGHLLGFYRVNDGERAVVQRFGAVVRQEDPGLRWLIPMVERYTAVSLSRINRVELGVPAQTAKEARASNADQLMMLTGDSNIVDMQFTVQWRVSDPEKFIFKMRNPDVTLGVASESVMREVMGQKEIMSAIGSGREVIRQEVEKRLRDLMATYDAGISVDSVQLQRMEAPAPVMDAFIKAQNAQQEANRVMNVAEGYRSSVLPQARAEANRLMEEARAYKTQVMANAAGDAARFNSIYTAYKTAEEPTMTRMYLETMEQVLGNSNKVVLGGNAADRALPYLPLEGLKPITAQPAMNNQQK